ncbi:DMT family transporter [Brevundimonas naejangsanensis]|uniref:DMT family transporter n=1 Tax=Brevundimonas naejangsanensis TaxID=588932 RepID=UPI0026EA76D7|nr:EamA family transporter [Brevundimonas naejangsanensis]
MSQSEAPSPEGGSSFARSPAMLAFGGVGVCALIWGTTWYAITFQLGAVDPVISVVLRFGIASALLALIVKATGGRLALTRGQHLAALGQGLFSFAISYAFVYASEEKIASAVVAVIFAALAFLNLILFRVASGQKAASAAWLGAGLGVVGVGVLSAGEVLGAGLGGHAVAGVSFAVIAVVASAFGNWFAWRGQQAGSQVLPSTAWAMAYGTGTLALYAVITGVSWSVAWSPAYVISLLYLAVFGSVIAFGLYFTIARARGYAVASYISALTPPIAMLVSVMFEGARFGVLALVGLALVLAGQLFLIRAPKRSAA